MYLNSLDVSKKSRKNRTRLGRGISSGLGKTSGRGHKGQKSRAGKKISRNFEGGQTPINRRVPKFGFISKKNVYTKEVSLEKLFIIKENKIDLKTLKSYNLINNNTKKAKIILSRKFLIRKTIHIIGIKVSANAKYNIELNGGTVI
ncbi:MAG: 50S ribosomal protein L15 [Candidatus Lightella neohaematopini]|nr:50S ribosomal protein L15 [Candidatus Lightella neohaematopini]